MDCLIIGPVDAASALENTLRDALVDAVNVQRVSVLGLAGRHLLYGTPDLIVIVGPHNRRSLERFSDTADLLGSHQLLITRMDADYVVVRQSGRRPSALAIPAGAMKDVVAREARRICLSVAGRPPAVGHAPEPLLMAGR